jgi:hypothetical protein
MNTIILFALAAIVPGDRCDGVTCAATNLS